MRKLLCLAIFFAMTFVAKAADAPYRHVVLFQFKADASPAAIAEVEKSFAALKSKIDVIQDFEWGTNVSPEKKDKGFTHCFILSFKSEKDRDAYLVHPDHKAFGKLVGPLLDDVFVFDFWAKK